MYVYTWSCISLWQSILLGNDMRTRETGKVSNTGQKKMRRIYAVRARTHHKIFLLLLIQLYCLRFRYLFLEPSTYVWLLFKSIIYSLLIVIKLSLPIVLIRSFHSCRLLLNPIVQSVHNQFGLYTFVPNLLYSNFLAFLGIYFKLINFAVTYSFRNAHFFTTC